MSDTAPPAGKDLSRGSLPVVIVAALLSAAIGAGISLGATRSELHEASSAAKQAQEDVHQHAVDIAVIKQQLQDFQESLKRIERAVSR